MLALDHACISRRAVDIQDSLQHHSITASHHGNAVTHCTHMNAREDELAFDFDSRAFPSDQHLTTPRAFHVSRGRDHHTCIYILAEYLPRHPHPTSPHCAHCHTSQNDNDNHIRTITTYTEQIQPSCRTATRSRTATRASLPSRTPRPSPLPRE